MSIYDKKDMLTQKSLFYLFNLRTLSGILRLSPRQSVITLKVRGHDRYWPVLQVMAAD